MKLKFIFVILNLVSLITLGAQEQRQLVIQKGHYNGIYKLAVHPTKDIVATAEQEVIKLWDSQSWTLLHTVAVQRESHYDWTIINLEFGESHLIVTTVDLQTDAYLDNYFGKKMLGSRTSLAINIASGEIEMDNGANFILASKAQNLISVFQKDAGLAFRADAGEISTPLAKGNFKPVDDSNRSWFLRPDIADDSLFITYASYSPREHLLVCGYSEGTVEIRDPKSFMPIHTFKTELKQIINIHFKSDSLLIVEGRNLDPEVLVLDLPGRRIRESFILDCENIDLNDTEYMIFSFAPLIFDQACNFATGFHAGSGWLAIVSQFNRIHLRNLYSGEEKSIDCPFSAVYDIAFLNDGGNLLISGDYGQQARFGQSPLLSFNLLSESFSEIPFVTFDYTENIGWTTDGKALYTLNLSSFVKWSLKDMSRVQTVVAQKKGNNYTNFIQAGQSAFGEIPTTFDDPILVYDLDYQNTSFVSLDFLKPMEEEENIVGLAPGQFIITADLENGFYVYDLRSKRRVYHFLLSYQEDFKLSGDGRWLVCFDRDQTLLKMISTDNWETVFRFSLDQEASDFFDLQNHFAFSVGDQKFAFFQDRFSPPDEGKMVDPILHHIQVYALLPKENKWERYRIFPYNDPINLLVFGYAGNTILTANWEAPYHIQRWDSSTGTLIQTLAAHEKPLEFIADHEDVVFSYAEDNTYRLWDKAESKPLLRIMNYFDGIRVSEVILNEENYYRADANGLRMVGYQIGEKGYPFEQLDLRQNRPDKVIASLPNADTTLVSAYHKAYLKRLEKMNFTPEMLTDELQIPKVEIIRSTKELISYQPEISFLLKASSEYSSLDRINVWVNDVPIYGVAGIGLRALDTQNEQRTINLRLSKGKNKIQASTLDQGGAESLKATTYITYETPEQKPGLYLITIGTTDYQASGKDLQYATKDAQDFAAFYQSADGFKEVYIKTLTDTLVTKTNILSLRQWLESTTVDDQVLLYVSGHGLLDDNYDFYYATHDTDFADPAKKGILYDEIEGLLDGIPARKKLLLMDACYSGEYDKDASQPTQEQLVRLQKKGVTFRSFSKGDGEGTPVLGLQNSFEMMQQLFADLRRGSGATVITSSSGVQVSYENEEWANGAFTYAFLYGLKTMKADANQDGQVTASEIQNFVADYVPRLTEGLQVPTFRRENLEFDFRVW